MSDKTKKLLKKIGDWLLFFFVAGLFVSIPNLYWTYHSPSHQQMRVVCYNYTETTEQKITIANVVLDPAKWNNTDVQVTGEIFYSEPDKSYIIRDGIFHLPFDTSGCESMDAFKNGRTTIDTKAQVFLSDGKPILVAEGIQQSLPKIIEMAYPAAVIWSLMLMTALVSLVIRLLAWLLHVIGVIKKKPEKPAEENLQKKAGMLFLTGLSAPFLWLGSPYLGATLQMAALIFYVKPGLRAPKRWVAIAGIVLCAAGLVVMTLVYAVFWDMMPINKYVVTHYFDIKKGATIKPAEPPLPDTLEPIRYLSTKYQFALNLPKGWIVDEKGTEDSPVIFKAPKEETLNGKPYTPIIKINGIKILDLKAGDFQEGVKALKDAMSKADKFTLVAEKNYKLTDSGLDAYFLEITFVSTEKDTDKTEVHAVGVMTLKDNILYFIGIDMPLADWDTYGQAVTDSLMTFDLTGPTNLGDFADCLKNKGTVVYGAEWCELCQAQRRQFGTAKSKVPYVDCEPTGKGESDDCVKKDIKLYPTWEFSDGSRVTGGQTLEFLAQKTGCVLPAAQ